MATAAPVPASGNSMGRLARKLVLFDRAKDIVGGARKLGEIIGCGRRAVNYKLDAGRELTNFELRLVADDMDRRAGECAALAADIRKVIA